MGLADRRQSRGSGSVRLRGCGIRSQSAAPALCGHGCRLRAPSERSDGNCARRRGQDCTRDSAYGAGPSKHAAITRRVPATRLRRLEAVRGDQPISIGRCSARQGC